MKIETIFEMVNFAPSVESTAEAPNNHKIGSQHSLQPNLLALLLLHDHTSKV